MTSDTALSVRVVPGTPYAFIACKPTDFELIRGREDDAYCTRADIALADAYSAGWAWAEEIDGESADGSPITIVMLERLPRAH
jgi:hypothetical protein